MRIKTVADKRLAAFIQSDGAKVPKGLNPQEAKKIWRQISAISAARTPRQIEGLPGWNIHELTPGHPGKWAMNVTANYRLTFHFIDGEAVDLAFEDYH